MTAPVRLAPAYSWQCPCGAKNWEDGVDHLRKIALAAWLGCCPREAVEEALDSPIAPPKAVRCRSCGEAFAAEGG